MQLYVSCSLLVLLEIKMALWTDELSLKLVALFKSKNLLWDMKNKSYYNRAAKEDAWKDIAVTIGRPADEVRSKMLSLQASFRRENRKVTFGTDNHDASNPYVSRWYAFEAMKFMEESKKQCSTRKNRLKHCTVLDPVKPDTDCSDDQKNEDLSHHSYDLVDLDEPLSSPLAHDVTPREDRGMKRKRSEDSDQNGRDHQYGWDHLYGRDHQYGRDQYAVFGELISIQIRDLPSPHARNVVKHLINNILFKAEMGKYDDPLRENYD